MFAECLRHFGKHAWCSQSCHHTRSVQAAGRGRNHMAGVQPARRQPDTIAARLRAQAGTNCFSLINSPGLCVGLQRAAVAPLSFLQVNRRRRDNRLSAKKTLGVSPPGKMQLVECLEPWRRIGFSKTRACGEHCGCVCDGNCAAHRRPSLVVNWHLRVSLGRHCLRRAAPVITNHLFHWVSVKIWKPHHGLHGRSNS